MSTKAPRHVGIIMDGNGRWALKRGLIRTNGHQEGLVAAKEIVRAAIDCNVQFLSLYTFSTENWHRSSDEIDFLLKMIASNLRKESQFYADHGVRVVHSGSLRNLPDYVISEIDWVKEYTKDYSNIVVNLAINYGGQDEIVRAVQRWKADAGSDKEFTDTLMRKYLDLPDFPDPDLIIRTGGEHRLSNFLLWGCAYAELYFSDKLWPDWSGSDFKEAVSSYIGRKRNFGRVKTKTPSLAVSDYNNG